MTDLPSKFTADYAATWSHTERTIECVGCDTSDDNETDDHPNGD